MTVREIIIHPEWNYTGLQYDIAILRTEENITFSNTANAACLPNWTISSKTDGQKMIISGWGAIAKEYDYNNETVATFPEILQVGFATGQLNSEWSTKIFPDFLKRQKAENFWLALWEKMTS